MKAIVKNKNARNFDDYEIQKERDFKNGVRTITITPFVLGDCYQTSGIYYATKDNPKKQKEVDWTFKRYTYCDWGDTCYEDWKMNDEAVKHGDDRIVAKYCLSFGNIFIITEWDRSATTVMFCGEY